MSGQPPRWNVALTYAITARRWDDLEEVGSPDLGLIGYEIGHRFPGGLPGLRTEIDQRLRAGDAWPYRVPDDLRAGLGAAQWLAALSELRRRLQVGPQPERPVLSDRKPDADEQRLLREVPPHHGR